MSERLPRAARAASASLALALLLALGAAHAQPAPEQSVWLKNGGFLRGALVELVPNDHVTLQLVTGEIRRIPAADIDRMTSSSAPAAPPASSALATAAPPASSAPAAPAVPASASAAPAGPAKNDSVVVRLVGPAAVELQGRPRLDRGSWGNLCKMPCDQAFPVIDREFRVAGEGVSPSRVFVIEPGERPVKLAVNPGQSSIYRAGTLSFLVGVPVLLIGGVGLAVGSGTNVDHHDEIRTAGLITAIAGGAMLLTALPLLYVGQTRVNTDRGVQIARRAPGTLF